MVCLNISTYFCNLYTFLSLFSPHTYILCVCISVSMWCVYVHVNVTVYGVQFCQCEFKVCMASFLNLIVLTSILYGDAYIWLSGGFWVFESRRSCNEKYLDTNIRCLVPIYASKYTDTFFSQLKKIYISHSTS